jgi:branched-chain amino acid transport system ATP-binding protein
LRAHHGSIDPVTGERRELARAGAAPPILSVRDLTVRFGGIVALDGVSFQVGAGQIVGLIGPNGAGKTTLFNCLSRLYTPDSGVLEFEGHPIHDTPAHRIPALGISRTFQNLALFPSLSVRQNVMIGAHCRSRGSFVAGALRLPSVRTEEERVRRLADELVAFFGLEGVAGHPAAGLPFGTLKRVELARALAGRPQLLLLDEPAAGLNHEEVGALAGLIRAIRAERGVTILLVEHHMGLVMEVSDRVVVLDFGRKIAEGSPDDVRQNADVIRAYLGVAPGETVAR